MSNALVTYTTLYREGGEKFERCAKTKAAELTARGYTVRCVGTESKLSFIEALERSEELAELHFFGHSGLYGIMFGTTEWPEQLSPYEWQTLKNPFVQSNQHPAQAYFHACRTGRWFAPFIARTLGIEAHGYQLYTAFSSRPDTLRWVPSKRDNLYMVSVPGKKSHGLAGSLGKYTGLLPAVPMTKYSSSAIGDEDTYNQVAELYDAAYADIRVRHDEWKWLTERVPNGADVCDIGCGTGALLRALEPRLKSGLGVDESEKMLEFARARGKGMPKLGFKKITGPSIPSDDASLDFVTSLLSFRYLDWDPMLKEIARVLRPGGRFLVVDMVASPAGGTEIPRALLDKARVELRNRQFPQFAESLSRLVRDEGWQEMLKYNPMRAEHEYRWFLSSRFPKGQMSILNVGMKSKILAFDSGPISEVSLAKMSYP